MEKNYIREKKAINRQLFFRTACDMGESLIVIDSAGTGVFEIDKKTGESQLLSMIIPLSEQHATYQSAERYGDKIFFFPFYVMLHKVLIYHISDRKITYVDLSREMELLKGGYIPIQKFGDKVFFFPVELASDLIVWDLAIDNISVIKFWSSTLKEVNLNYTSSFRKVSRMLKVGDSYYFTVIRSNYIVEMNCNTYEIRLHKLPEHFSLFTDMDFDGSNFWIITSDSGVMKWNPNQGVLDFISIDANSEQPRFKDILCGRDYVWLIPYLKDNRIVRLHRETKEYTTIEIFPGEFTYDTDSISEAMFETIHRDENKVDLYPLNGNLAIHIDLENDILLEHHERIDFPDDWSDEIIIDHELRMEKESKRMNTADFLDEFIEHCKNDKCMQGESMNGKKIWDCLK